jgi:asparagine synthase (glutamine-hydrolysing)
MSAIFGIVHFDGAPVAEGDLNLMSAALVRHGPDGGGVYLDGNVGLGQRLARFTPEDCLERQPVVDAERRRVLVSDARIDNRPELMEELRIPLAEARELPDSAFILRAHDKWGADCAGHLVGAFVFALHDLKERRVLIARSPLGERSLFYYETPRLLAFASAPKGLFALPYVPRQINPQSVADYLAYASKEPGSSFFASINRLQPGYSIVAGPSGFQSRENQQLEIRDEIRLPRDSDYVEAFTELFDLVITRQMRSLTPVGLSMSGGLDSTAIATVMASELSRKGAHLHTFTEVPPAGFRGPVPKGRYADETPYVQAVARRYDNIDLHFVHSGEHAYLNEIDRFFEAGDAPIRIASHWPWVEAVLDEARKRNVRILMTGVPGNLTFSWTGEGLLARLVREGNYRRALRESRALAAAGKSSFLRPLVSRGLMPLAPDWVWHAWQRHRVGRMATAAEPVWHRFSPLRLEFARAQRVDERARQKGDGFRFRTSPADRIRHLIQRADPRCDGRRTAEVLFGVQTLDPANDIRLTRFCLSIPEDQFLREGQSRWLIRRAMAQRLPAEVLDNRMRGLQAANWHETTMRSLPRMEAALGRLERSALAREAIDVPRMRRLLGELQDVPEGALPSMERRDLLDHGLAVGSFLAWVEGVD